MSLTNKAIGGVFWAFLERFGTQILQLVIFVVLARILEPAAFGLMGLLAVFIAVSQSISESGFSDALIQKKDADEVDFSSVFYINLLISTSIYGILFITAPFVAQFFSEPILADLLRVLGLKFIISAFSLVQITKLMKEIKFKKLMLVKLPSTLLGGFAGIFAAYEGWGVWSLVVQQLVDASAFSIQIWIQSKWIPKRVFDLKRVGKLFSFGSKMMIESILYKLYKNFSELVIGRNFSMAEVGFYTQANKIKQVPISNISSALGKVTYPILADIQDQDARLKNAYKRIIRLIFLIVAPVMVGLVVLAEPLFVLLLTETWLPAVPYFQWLCVGGILYPVQSYNLNILKVKGRSDLFLYLGIIKKLIGIAGILFFIQISVLALVMFRAGNAVFAYFINSYYSGRLIGYGVFEQIRDIWKFITAAAFSGVITHFIIFAVELPMLVTIGGGLIMGAIIYISLIWMFDRSMIESAGELFQTARKKIK